MSLIDTFIINLEQKQTHFTRKTLWQRIHLDVPLLLALLLVIGLGFVVLYSASSQNMPLMTRQVIRLSMGFFALCLFAQIPPHIYRQWSPAIFFLGIGLLVAVMLMGKMGKGAQRWLNLGFFNFQPSEILKLALPMMLAWYLSRRPLPPTWLHLIASALLIAAPTLLIGQQPDLGTALMVALSGAAILLFAGIRWRIIFAIMSLAVLALPVLWHFMHDYQKQRVLTFLNPERDPLGSGYHIIQSKIAIGSGGLFGKGWLHGTQSQLQFLPEHTTDFIFAVCGEEFGFIGCVALLTAYMIVLIRCLMIAAQAQTNYTRLLAAGIAFSFFLSMFVNVGMVMGLLPVVGLPLPLMSYGGTSIVTLMIGFGMLMSIHTYKKLHYG